MPNKPTKTHIPPDFGSELFEVTPTVPICVAETSRVYRLTPTVDDLAQPRQIALIAADTETHARALAAAHDPFGKDWADERNYCCEYIQSDEAQVVGEVVFKSVPARTTENLKRR